MSRDYPVGSEKHVVSWPETKKGLAYSTKPLTICNLIINLNGRGALNIQNEDLKGISNSYQPE